MGTKDSLSPQQKVEYFDALVEREHLTNLRDTAKQLGCSQTRFIQYLLDRKYLYRDQRGKLKPYAAYIPALFNLKEYEHNGYVGLQTLVTPEGREVFRNQINNHNPTAKQLTKRNQITDHNPPEKQLTKETSNQTSD